MGLLLENAPDHFLDLGDAGHAPHQDHLVDLGRIEAGVGERLLAGLPGPLDQVIHELLELGAGELEGKMLGPALIGRDEGQIDLGLHGRRKLDLGLFRGLLEPLESHGVLGQVDALVLLEFSGDPVHHPLIEVVPSQMSVPVGGENLENPVSKVEDGDVESPPPEVEDGDLLVLLLIQAIGQGSGGGLVHDPQHLQPRNLARVLGGLALGVVEISRDRDHRLFDFFPQIALGVGFQFLQDHGRDFRRRIHLAVDLDPGVVVIGLDHLIGDQGDLAAYLAVTAAHETLDGKNRVGGIGDGLAFGRLPHQALPALGESHYRGGGPIAFRVGDDFRLLPLHDGDAGIGRAQIYAENF